MVFVVHGKPFQAHRCILGAHSAYFFNVLDTKWKGKSVIVLRHPLVCPSLGEGREGVEGQQGLVLGHTSGLPSWLAACGSALWPLGPCCSTCTQMTPRPSLVAGRGLHFCPAADPAVALGDLLLPGTLSPEWEVVPPASWVGLGD